MYKAQAGKGLIAREKVVKFCFGLGRFFFKSLTTSAATFQFRFVLFTETVSCGEKVPTSTFIHVPDVGLLAGVLRLILVDQVHEEKSARKFSLLKIIL